jgi:hypothetical protein
VAARRPGQWISALVLLVLFAMLVNTIITNGRFQWGVVGDYFVSGSIMRGLVLTLWLTAAVMGCGFLLGIPFGHEFVTVKTAHLFAKWGVGGDLISKSVLNPATTF